MKIYFLPKDKVNLLVESVLDEFQVFGPKAKETKFEFGKINSAEELRLDYNTTILPPVKTFFPNDEKILEFKPDGKTESVHENSKKVIFGVHPCDIHAIEMMDNIFSTPPEDKHYLERRKDSIIIGINCNSPCSDKTLCYDKGTYKADSGFDLMLWDNGESYLVEVVTSLGNFLASKFSYFFNFFTEYSGEFHEFKTEYHAKQDLTFEKKLTRKISELPEAMRQSYESELWHEVGAKCLSCGSCNIVCPTCYCFDVKDVVDIDLAGGHRCRNWDSCQNLSFACVGSGENFREKSSQRNRHRVFKKEVYLPQNKGYSGCVGCGRCNTACIAGINLVDIYNNVFSEAEEV